MELTTAELRDYYIAHAPPVPEWFALVIPDEPHRELNPSPALKALLNKPREQWSHDECVMRDAEDAARVEHNRLHAEWREMARRERLLQWPLYWADEMMKRRQQAA